MVHQIRSGAVAEAFGSVADQRSCLNVERQHLQNGLEVHLPEQAADSPDCQRFKGGRCRSEGPDGMRMSVEEANIHCYTAVGGLPERGEVHFADSCKPARTFKHDWGPVQVEAVSLRRIPLVIPIGGLLGARPAEGEILRSDSGKLLGDGHGNQYRGGVHPFFEYLAVTRSSPVPVIPLGLWPRKSQPLPCALRSVDVLLSEILPC